jgi:hypothetical protein
MSKLISALGKEVEVKIVPVRKGRGWVEKFEISSGVRS